MDAAALFERITIEELDGAIEQLGKRLDALRALREALAVSNGAPARSARIGRGRAPKRSSAEKDALLNKAPKRSSGLIKRKGPLAYPWEMLDPRWNSAMHRISQAQLEWDQAGMAWWNGLSPEQRKQMLYSAAVCSLAPTPRGTPAGSPARCWEVFGPGSAHVEDKDGP